MGHEQLLIAGIILAAGCSTRMGRAKQLLPYKGRPLLQHVLDSAAHTAQLDRVVLLLGHRSEEIRKCLDPGRAEVRLVPGYELGLSASLRRGVEEAERMRASAVLFLLGDRPLVSPEAIDRVASSYRRKRDPILVAACDGRRGHPVVMDRALFPRLREVRGDVGGREIMAQYEGLIREVEVSCSGIHVDVDEWEDYMQLLQEG